jgi:hypothetical protein
MIRIFSVSSIMKENLADMSDKINYTSRFSKLVYEMQNSKACVERPVAGNGSVAGCFLSGCTGE